MQEPSLFLQFLPLILLLVIIVGVARLFFGRRRTISHGSSVGSFQSVTTGEKVMSESTAQTEQTTAVRLFDDPARVRC